MGTGTGIDDSNAALPGAGGLPDPEESPQTIFVKNVTGRVAYVWSAVYVDALVLRDRDLSGDGSYDERLYVQQDANYNPASLSDNTGAVVERFLFDPYGVATFLDPNWAVDAGGSDYAWTHLHQGGRHDPLTGLVHFRFRDYRPTLGRWTQQDPAGYIDGPSRYQALRSNPTSYVDPLGLQGRHRKDNGVAQPQQMIGALDVFYIDVDGPRVVMPKPYRDTEGWSWWDVGWFVGETSLSVAVEPVDWILTAWEVYKDPFNPLSYAGLIPGIPTAAGKLLKNADEVLAPAKRVSGQTVLGRYPEYVQLSEQVGARRFEVPDFAWKGMSPAEQWEANKKFLDRTIARGDEIILSSNPLDPMLLRGSYAKEIQYLLDRGYHISPDGTRLVAPGAR